MMCSQQIINNWKSQELHTTYLIYIYIYATSLYEVCKEYSYRQTSFHCLKEAFSRRSVQDGIYVLGKTHMCPTPSLRNCPWCCLLHCDNVDLSYDASFPILSWRIVELSLFLCLSPPGDGWHEVSSFSLQKSTNGTEEFLPFAVYLIVHLNRCVFESRVKGRNRCKLLLIVSLFHRESSWSWKYLGMSC